MGCTLGLRRWCLDSGRRSAPSVVVETSEGCPGRNSPIGANPVLLDIMFIVRTMIVETITGPSATGKSECAREISEQAQRPRYVFDIDDVSGERGREMRLVDAVENFVSAYGKPGSNAHFIVVCQEVHPILVTALELQGCQVVEEMQHGEHVHTRYQRLNSGLT